MSPESAALERTRDVLPEGGRIAALERQVAALQQELAALRSRDRQREDVVRDAPIVLWSVDLEGRFTLSEGGGLRSLGMEANAILGDNVFEMYADHPDIPGNVRRAMAGEEFVARTSVGDVDWETHFAPIRDFDGMITGMAGASINITPSVQAARRQREAESRLESSERLYRDLFLSSRDGIAFVDMEGRFEAVNPAYCRLLGYTEEELRHLTYKDVTPAHWHAYEHEILTHEISQHGTTREYEKEYVTKDRRIIPIRIRVWGRYDAQGRPTGLWGLVRDISEELRSEAGTRFRLDFERLISSISTQFLSTPIEQFGEALDEALAAIGGLAGVERAAIYKLDDPHAARRTHAWSAPGVPSDCDALAVVHLDAALWNDADGRLRDTLRIDALDQLPDSAGPLAAQLAQSGVQSWLAVPMDVAGVRHGFVTLAVLQARVWDDDLVSLMRIVGTIFAHAVLGHDAESARRASELKFRRLFNTTADPVLLHDFDGRIVDVNDRACGALEYSRAQLLRMSLADLDPAWNPTALGELRERLHSGETARREANLRRSGHAHFPAELHVGLFDANERLLLSVVRDLTASKSVELELRTARQHLEQRVRERTADLRRTNLALESEIQKALAAEARWRTLVENAPDFILQVNPQGIIEFVNRGGPFGGVEEIAGTHLSAWVGEPFKSETLTALERVLATGEPAFVEVHMEDGASSRWYASTYGPIVEDGVVRSVIIIASDITARKEIEETRRRHQTSLAHAQRLSVLGQLVAEIAHTVRQPLMGLEIHAGTGRSQVEQLQLAQPEKLLETFDDILEATHHVADYITWLLRYASKREMVCQTFDLHETIRTALRLIEPEARRAGCELGLSLAAGPAWIEGDPLQIEQVILNLALNGCEAMHASPVRRLDIATTLHAGEVTLAISDTGPGLRPEDAAKVFDPFYTTKAAGLGLGLAITHTAVRFHQGTIAVEPSTSGGARFLCRLPLSRQETSA